MRAVIGQQVSVAGARTVAGRLVAGAGPPLAGAGRTGDPPLPRPPRRCWPPTPPTFAMPASRRQRPAGPGRGGGRRDGWPSTRVPTRPRSSARLARPARASAPGPPPTWPCGPSGDPDAFLPTDLGVRRALAPAGRARRPGGRAALAERWRPWRAYAAVHLWAATEPATAGRSAPTDDHDEADQQRSAQHDRRPSPPPPAHRPTAAVAASWSTARSAPLAIDGDDEALTHLFLPNTGWPPPGGLAGPAARRRCAQAADPARRVLRRAAHRFDLPLAPSGTPFQVASGGPLADIPYGTDHQLRRAGRRGSAGRRPSGRSARPTGPTRSPSSTLPPGGRLRGGLGGYGGGLDVKRRLLALEGWTGPD